MAARRRSSRLMFDLRYKPALWPGFGKDPIRQLKGGDTPRPIPSCTGRAASGGSLYQ